MMIGSFLSASQRPHTLSVPPSVSMPEHAFRRRMSNTRCQVVLLLDGNVCSDRLDEISHKISYFSLSAPPLNSTSVFLSELLQASYVFSSTSSNLV